VFCGAVAGIVMLGNVTGRFAFTVGNGLGVLVGSGLAVGVGVGVTVCCSLSSLFWAFSSEVVAIKTSSAMTTATIT